MVRCAGWAWRCGCCGWLSGVVHRQDRLESFVVVVDVVVIVVDARVEGFR